MIRSMVILFMVLAVCTVLSTAIPPKDMEPRAQSLNCYDCSCTTLPCSCDQFDTVTDDNTYCMIVIYYSADGEHVSTTYGHVERNSTRIYIRDLPYILVEESIIYSDATQVWNTKTNIVLYGCNWDSCNAPTLVQYLPQGFQMRLPPAWLDKNVLGNKTTIRDCHHCPDAPQCGSESFLDASRCPVIECNTTCIVSDTFNDPAKDELCYQSRCVSPSEDLETDPHRVELEGILYLRKPSREVELWEIDLYCRADDCSRKEIFEELRAQYTVSLGDLSVFNALLPTSTSSSTTTTTAGAEKLFITLYRMVIIAFLTTINLLF